VLELRCAGAICTVTAAVASFTGASLASGAGGGTRPSYCPVKRHALDGVYHPARLVIMRVCQRASGVVRDVRLEEDGDLHIRFHLTATYAALTNDVNDAKQHGDLVVEFMPRDGGHLPKPAIGNRLH
jgi:hypothetical protein